MLSSLWDSSTWTSEWFSHEAIIKREKQKQIMVKASLAALWPTASFRINNQKQKLFDVG